jgi:hypothetical protein
VRINDFLEYPPSIAASKDRIVSRGLSHRLRVGLDLSGSAVQTVSFNSLAKQEDGPTDRVALTVSMLDCSNRCQR